MPNLKDIRNRIKSVKSTQKITAAMKMVAAAKVKRAENRVKAARAYAEQVLAVMTRVYNEMKNQHSALSGSRYLELLAPREIRNVGIVVMTSDRGLCGSYNSAILRRAFQMEKAMIAEGLTPKFYLVGNKAIQAFSRYSQSEVLGRMGNMSAAPTLHHANEIADTLVQAFHDGKIDSIELLSTDFVSMISYQIVQTGVIPVKGKLTEFQPDIRPEQGHVSDQVVKTNAHARPELLLAPDPVATLDQLVPMYLSNIVYIQLLEASASELAARMTAMSNATKNAGEMIDRLTIVYNKARQASITQEILEVVSGAAALK